MHTIVPVEKRAFLPIEDVLIYTMNPKPAIKTWIEIRARLTIVPVRERSFLPIKDVPTFAINRHHTITIKTTVTRIKPTLLPI